MKRYFALATLALGFLGGAPALAQTPAKMTLTGVPPRQDAIFLSGNAWSVFASGTIDKDAAARLSAYIKSNDIPQGSQIFLNATDGDTPAAIALGKVIRDNDLSTYVGTQKAAGKRNSAPGQCLDACALAFMGGKFRYAPDKSRYGFRRAIAQDPTVARYLQEMEINSGALSIPGSASDPNFIEPTLAQLNQFDVTNNGKTRTTWTVHTLKADSPGDVDVTYLKGQRDTTQGINKFILQCIKKKLQLLVIFDPQGREDEYMAYNVDYLFIDGKKTQIDKSRLNRQVVNGWINAGYRLTDAQIAAIAQAKTLGVVSLPTPQAGMFAGFDSLPVDSPDTIGNFVQSCKG
ncbi:hypothetical protein [Bradyrhizobium sp. 2TAF24]|uniref:hypothetical protein n=1 Tax=Bradyrhizobium sp. 2TAF24 TaxID=3233011 RepID=UPI003F8EF7B3